MITMMCVGNNINVTITMNVSREKLQLEIAARERAERKQQEYEDRLRSLQEEMERSQVHNSTYFSYFYYKKNYFSAILGRLLMLDYSSRLMNNLVKRGSMDDF